MLTSTTGSASTAPPSSANGSTRTGRATASLKRIFRQTFQPKNGRSGASTISSSSPSRRSRHVGVLPQIPRVDTVFLKDFDEVGAGVAEWEKRQSVSSGKSRNVRIRRVSTLGATVSLALVHAICHWANNSIFAQRGRPLRRSRTEVDLWFKGSFSARPIRNQTESPSKERRPCLKRTDDSVIYPGSPMSTALKSGIKWPRTESPTPQRRRASASSALHAYSGEDELHDQESDSNTGSDSEDDGSEESFTSAPMSSPRDVDVVFDHKCKSESDISSPSSTLASSNGGSTWKYSRYGTHSPLQANGSRRSIQHMLDQSGFLDGTTVKALNLGQDDERKESQRSYALARLEGRTPPPRKAPEWTSIFALERVGSSNNEEDAQADSGSERSRVSLGAVRFP